MLPGLQMGGYTIWCFRFTQDLPMTCNIRISNKRQSTLLCIPWIRSSWKELSYDLTIYKNISCEAFSLDKNKMRDAGSLFSMTHIFNNEKTKINCTSVYVSFYPSSCCLQRVGYLDSLYQDPPTENYTYTHHHFFYLLPLRTEACCMNEFSS